MNSATKKSVESAERMELQWSETLEAWCECQLHCLLARTDCSKERISIVAIGVDSVVAFVRNSMVETRRASTEALAAMC